MPFNWDDANQKRLLLIIIHLTAPSPPKWDQVAPLLGEGCTAEAARQQFKNLKGKAKKEFGELPEGAGAGETPEKGKKSAAGGTPKSGGKRKKNVEANAEDEEETPVKKVKAEADGEEGGEDGL